MRFVLGVFIVVFIACCHLCFKYLLFEAKGVSVMDLQSKGQICTLNGIKLSIEL